MNALFVVSFLLLLVGVALVIFGGAWLVVSPSLLHGGILSLGLINCVLAGFGFSDAK